MRLGSRAKLTIGVGLTAAGMFGFLGLRDLLKADVVPQAAPMMGPALETAVVLAASTRPIRIGETITADMIRNAALDPARHPGIALPERRSARWPHETSPLTR